MMENQAWPVDRAQHELLDRTFEKQDMHASHDGGEKLVSEKCSNSARSSGQHLDLTTPNSVQCSFLFFLQSHISLHYPATMALKIAMLLSVFESRGNGSQL